jgi:hypothetical protein
MSKVGQKWNVEGRDILSRINPIPLSGVNMFLISGLRQITGVYISIFKVDLAGNKRLIELGYEMDIIAFNLLLKLQIYSSYQQFNLPSTTIDINLPPRLFVWSWQVAG